MKTIQQLFEEVNIQFPNVETSYNLTTAFRRYSFQFENVKTANVDILEFIKEETGFNSLKEKPKEPILTFVSKNTQTHQMFYELMKRVVDFFKEYC